MKMQNPRLAALDELDKHLIGASKQRMLSKKQKAALHAKKKDSPLDPAPTDVEPDDDDEKPAKKIGR